MKKKPRPKISTTDIENLIHEWIHDERNRSIVHRRLIDNIGFEALAEEYELSVSQVKRIAYDGEAEIFSHI